MLGIAKKVFLFTAKYLLKAWSLLVCRFRLFLVCSDLLPTVYIFFVCRQRLRKLRML